VKLSLIPWQVYAAAVAFVIAGLVSCDIRRDGERAAETRIERKQQEAADAARKEVDRLRGGADRSRVRQFDRD
jgi:hypothetical protein